MASLKWIHINSVALLLVSERKFANGKKLVFKSYPHFFKKSLTSIFKFSTENFVDEISYFFQKLFHNAYLFDIKSL